MKTRLALGCSLKSFIACAAVGFGFVGLGPAEAKAASSNVLMITSNPNLEEGQKGFAGFLRRQGYNVAVTPAGDVTYFTLDTDATEVRDARIRQLESYDLVIIHRNFGSGTLAGSEAEIAIWNRLRVPLLLCNAPIVRNNRWRWMNANSGGINTTSPNLILDQPAHPIVAGLNADLFRANRIYGGMIQGNDGGPHATSIARASIAGFDPICLTVWDEAPGEERPFYAGSGQTFIRRRVFFELHEYRNNPDAAVNDPWNEVSENGERLFAHAVEYSITGTVAPKLPPQIAELVPADGSTFWLTFDPIRFRVTSGEPLLDASLRLVLNGNDVSQDLIFSGSATDREVTYEALQPNRAYHAVITASNSFGSRTAQTRFDTFDPSQVFTLGTADGLNFSGSVGAGVYRLYLRVVSTTARTLALRSGATPEDPVKGVFYVSVTGNPPAPTLIPLSDAPGAELLLRRSGPQTFLLTGGGEGTVAMELICALVEDAPAVLSPVLALAQPEPKATGVSPLAGLVAELAYRDTVIEPASIRIFLNGEQVTGVASIVPTGEGARLSYVPPSFLAPGSSNHVRLSFTDSALHELSAEYSFIVRHLAAIPAAFATATDTGTDGGFNIRNHMAPGAAGVNFTNSIARAELQLSGLLTGLGGSPVTNQINGTPLPASLVEMGTINYGPTEGGAAARFPNDALFPGAGAVPANNIALEATAYVALSAGINRFGVRSDDGFRLTAGETFANQDVELSGYEGPRGDQVPTEFDVLVYRDGLYALRFVYFDGGGGASVEWYGIYESGASPDSADGRVLINGPDSAATPRARAYRNRTATPVIPSPELAVVAGSGQLIISWNAQANFLLESSSDLSTTHWSPRTQAQEINGNRKVVHLPIGSGAQFFRLRRL